MTKQQWTKDNFLITDEKDELDLDIIFNFLSKESYWSKGISREDVEKSIENSTICFGLYEINTKEKKQIGFARVITDLVTFSYLTDVFILKEVRGIGLGKWLIQTITEYDKLKIRRIMLSTDDGHSLYSKYGFKPLDHPDLFMQIKGPGAL